MQIKTFTLETRNNFSSNFDIILWKLFLLPEISKVCMVLILTLRTSIYINGVSFHWLDMFIILQPTEFKPFKVKISQQL